MTQGNPGASPKPHRWRVVVLLALAMLWSSASLADQEDKPEPHRFRFGAELKQDFKGFYGEQGLPPLLIGIGAACVLANTSVDQSFQDWYQDSVRNDTTDSVSGVFKPFGEGTYVIPVALGGYLYALIGHKPNSVFGRWGGRTLRGFIVGVPTLLFMQKAAGASRPSDNVGSQWDPFMDSNGASGHAFIAAVPFVTGAKMARKKSVKGVLYFASTLTAWSRINDNQHYLSQAALGWWIGYLSTVAVNRTEHARHVQLAPIFVPGGVGVMTTIRLGRAPDPRTDRVAASIGG